MTSSYWPAQSAGHPIPPNRIETFLQDYQRGRRDFRYLGNLLNIDLSGKNLSEPNSKGEYLNLSGTYLRCANLSEANLSRVNLSGTDLSKANLTGAKLYGADLREATLHDTKFENAYYDEQTQFPKSFDSEKNGLKKEWISADPGVKLTEVQPTHHTVLPIENPVSVKPTEVQQSLVDKPNERLVKDNQHKREGLNGKVPRSQSGTEKCSKAFKRKTSHDELQEKKEKADQIGIKGEASVNAYLGNLKKNGHIDSFKWVAAENATSDHDFWVSIDGKQKNLIDVKSTAGNFDNVIHISLPELRQMAYGKERYDIYRVFEINESNKTVKLRILEGVKDFAKNILTVFEGLPSGVLADSVSVYPSTLNFQPEIKKIQIPDELEEK